ncbi:MAG: hypothetical protein V2A66_08075 [Pseudomonadota bacterium]
MKGRIAILCVLLAAFGCSKPLASARVRADGVEYSRSYAASANDVYYAAKWAFVKAGLSVANENLQDGILTTTWLPVSSDSHYVEIFGRPDYGVTNSYYQIEIKIVPGGGRTEVRALSRVKTIVARLKSSGIKENEVLESIGDALRKGEPTVTNLGVDE